jgi:hypothetical protein
MKLVPAEKLIIPMEDRPRCIEEGCDEPGHHTGRYRKSDGMPYFRTRCEKHHAEYQGKKKGQTSRQWRNSFHPYLHQRKDYCENIDGRLGFVCTTTITMDAMLQVDHIDGCPDNNDPENLQTFCACCHIHKTVTNKDYATPGRKTLKNG